MNEQEWLTCTEPLRMLEWMQEDGQDPRREYPAPVSDRKLRLFADACRERFYGSATNGGTESASEYDSRLRDNGLEPIVSARGWAAEMCVSQKPIRAAILRDIIGNPFRPVLLSVCPACEGAGSSNNLDGTSDCCARCDGTGEGAEPDWLTPTVSAIAGAIYTERRFEDMPVLGDALEDSGCADEDVLRHCRNEEPVIRQMGGVIATVDLAPRYRLVGWRPMRSQHVRGCHVLDAILGKE